jgi:hypothetical protein
MTVSLIPANIEYLAFAIQVDKDTAAAAPVIAVSLQECSLDPNRQEQLTAESDRSAQQGERMVMGAQPGGSFKKYCRPSEEDFFLHALLGKTVDAGAGPYTHTSNVDPAAPFSSPYLTVWDIWPGNLRVRYDGVRIASAKFDSQPGGELAVEYTLEALKATYLDADPTVTGLFVDELPFSWANLSASLGGVHEGVVNSVSCTVSRGTTRFPGDNGLNSLDVPNGLLAVTGSLEVAFQNDDLTRAANTGTTTGTVVTTDVFDEALALDFTRGASLQVKLAMADMQIGNFRTALKTDASPAVSTFDFNSKRQATISNAIQSLVKNAIATATRA